MVDFNKAARDVVEKFGFTFIDIANVYSFVPRYSDDTEEDVSYTTDGNPNCIPHTPVSTYSNL
jgi:hypothetical protein